jgi:hypothetical protein
MKPSRAEAIMKSLRVDQPRSLSGGFSPAANSEFFVLISGRHVLRPRGGPMHPASEQPAISGPIASKLPSHTGPAQAIERRSPGVAIPTPVGARIESLAVVADLLKVAAVDFRPEGWLKGKDKGGYRSPAGQLQRPKALEAVAVKLLPTELN